jgi:hypothetical protein
MIQDDGYLMSFLAGELSQLQPLVEYQQRMLQDLQDGARRYRDVLKANEELEKKLESAVKDLEFEKVKRKQYENRYFDDFGFVCENKYSWHILTCFVCFQTDTGDGD